ncbi:C39 family peptidase [Levilactobacillus mulengensis]|uniref:C39 family peptidase n=1 Tax=Levilactobacillus mulengensis TaxID=2486025 RepID=UPI000F77B912|nr:C39 family peptidase [Levilactobacillus mulengensis]
MFKQLSLGLAVGLAVLGLGVTAQAASSQQLVSQKSVTRYGQVTGNVKGKLYAFKTTGQALTLTATHQLKNYPHTAWIVSKSAVIQKTNGKHYRYSYVTSTSSKTKKTVSGWVWAHYLKTPTTVKLGAPYVSQQAVKAWMGCESASLLEGLHYKGVLTSTGLVAFMKHLPRSKNNNPNNGFAGSPYKVTPGVFQSIFPKPLAKWGNRYEPVKNISGAKLAKLRAQLRLHNPVVVYVTLHFAKAQYGHYFWGTGINNSHVMLLDGYKSGAYHVADPNHGKYWVSAKKFARSYNYKHFAVAIQ